MRLLPSKPSQWSHLKCNMYIQQKMKSERVLCVCFFTLVIFSKQTISIVLWQISTLSDGKDRIMCGSGEWRWMYRRERERTRNRVGKRKKRKEKGREVHKWQKKGKIQQNISQFHTISSLKFNVISNYGGRGESVESREVKPWMKND